MSLADKAAEELSEYVKRYTTLEYALIAIKTQTLALPNPSRWDDSNDREFVNLYRRHIAAKSVYAMCCTMSPERYHHWRIFTDKKKANGVCIEFKREPFQKSLNRMPNVRAEPVKYVSLRKFRQTGSYETENLPFIKRNGYRDEREWRILLTSPKPQDTLFEIPFSLAWVHRVILNPWMEERDREAARQILKSLLEKTVRVSATFLTNSAEWKDLGRRIAR